MNNQNRPISEGEIVEAPVRIIRERRPRAPRISLSTTPDIIDRALPRNSGHCVWADAVAEAVPDAKYISVDLQTIRFTDAKRGCRYTYLTPRTVQVDLVNFDLGVKPQPTTIRLRGGMVTKAGKARHGSSLPKRATLVDRHNGTSGVVADRVGGKVPPKAAFGHTGGRRREFGLRGLGVVEK